MNPMRWIQEYRRESDQEIRAELANSLCQEIMGDVALFIYGRVHALAAEDVLQEALATIFINLDKFRGNADKQFLAFCYRIASVKVAMYYRKRKRFERFIPIEELSFMVEEIWQYSLGWELEMPDLRDALSLLEKAKPGCQKLLWDHIIVDLDYEAIAERLRLKPDAVRMRIERCLAKAKELVKGYERRK